MDATLACLVLLPLTVADVPRGIEAVHPPGVRAVRVEALPSTHGRLEVVVRWEGGKPPFRVLRSEAEELEWGTEVWEKAQGLQEREYRDHVGMCERRWYRVLDDDEPTVAYRALLVPEAAWGYDVDAEAVTWPVPWIDPPRRRRARADRVHLRSRDRGRRSGEGRADHRRAARRPEGPARVSGRSGRVVGGARSGLPLRREGACGTVALAVRRLGACPGNGRGL